MPPESDEIEGNGAEAGMEKGAGIPEDPHSTDEQVLMRRLMELLGKDGPTGMVLKGCSLRLFIRGSKDAADSPDTAIAMREAINETLCARREGRIKKSVFGFLYTRAFELAAAKGWKLDSATMKWVKGKPFNMWERRQQMKNSMKH